VLPMSASPAGAAGAVDGVGAHGEVGDPEDEGEDLVHGCPLRAWAAGERCSPGHAAPRNREPALGGRPAVMITRPLVNPSSRSSSVVRPIGLSCASAVNRGGC
jgi:hypothetical protein